MSSNKADRSHAYRWLRFAVLIGGVVAIMIVAHVVGFRWWDLTPGRVRTYVLSFGLWAPLIYFVAFAQPLIPLPASVMLMAGGLAFGTVGGLTTALSAATTRACGQFMIARYLGRDAVESILRGRLAALHYDIGKRGFLAVLLFRCFAMVPYDVQNFSLGFSRVPFVTFISATVLALIPLSLLWVSLGQTLTEPAEFWKIIVLLVLLVAFWSVRTYRKGHAQRSPS